MMLELKMNNFKSINQVPIPVYYKENVVGDYYCDILVEDEIVLELKVAKTIDPIHEAQLLNYLKATRLKVGYILNFGLPDKLQFKRMVN